MRLRNISLLVLVLLAFTSPSWAIGIAGSAGGKRVTVSVDGTWQGTYAAGTTYVLGDIVTDGTTNYRSLQNANTGHTPASSPLYWQAILVKGDTGPTGATGSQGPTGVSGADGKTVLTTSGAPASGTGVNGDYAYDPATYTMYGPKAAGAWPAGTIIKGADGAGFTGGSDGTYGWLTDSNTSTYSECASGKYGLNFVGGVLYQCSNGTNSVFTSGDSLPTQTGNSGKYLTTNGTAASWGTIAAGSGIAISTDIPTETGAANLNDSTHVLTVASSTGYTQFTGSFTAWDTTPAAFAFTDLTDVALSTTQTATPVQITSINYPTAVTATGGTAAICTGATVGTCGTFSASPGNVALNQYVSAQHISSSGNSTAVNTVVTIGGASDVFRSTTITSIDYAFYWDCSTTTTNQPSKTATVNGSYTTLAATSFGDTTYPGNMIHTSQSANDEYYSVPVSAGDIFSNQTARVKFYYRTPDISTSPSVFIATGQTGDINFSFQANGAAKLIYGLQTMYFSAGDGQFDVQSSTWYLVEIGWDVSTSKLSISVNGTKREVTLTGSVSGSTTSLRFNGGDYDSYGDMDEIYTYINYN